MPKVFVFAPAGDSHKDLEAAGCDVVLGKKEWHAPGKDHTPELVEAATGAAALAGTSMRNTPISRAILEASPDLRIVAKCTVGVDDIDVDAATELGIAIGFGSAPENFLGVAEAVVESLEPIQKRYHEIVAEPGYVASVLREGAERVTPIARDTCDKVKHAMGIYTS